MATTSRHGTEATNQFTSIMMTSTPKKRARNVRRTRSPTQPLNYFISPPSPPPPRPYGFDRRFFSSVSPFVVGSPAKMESHPRPAITGLRAPAHLAVGGFDSTGRGSPGDPTHLPRARGLRSAGQREERVMFLGVGSGG